MFFFGGGVDCLVQTGKNNCLFSKTVKQIVCSQTWQKKNLFHYLRKKAIHQRVFFSLLRSLFAYFELKSALNGTQN